MYVTVDVILVVVVIMTVESPLVLVNVTRLSKIEVDKPVDVEVAGAEVTLTLRPPVGRTSIAPLEIHSDQVWLPPAMLEVDWSDTSVALVVGQALHVLLVTLDDVELSIELVVAKEVVVVVAEAEEEVLEDSKDFVKSSGVDEDTLTVADVLEASEVVVVT